MGDILAMSKKERKALIELSSAKEGKQTLGGASLQLDITYRHVRRKNQRFILEGEKGLVHRSRGRKSNRSYPKAFREECLELYSLRLSGYGPTFAAEKLEELGHKINPETLRLWLIEAGLWERQRKRGSHRQWREPKKHFGEMIQMDGSFHDWFNDGGKSCLMNMVDDATGFTYAQFYKEETTEAAMRMLWGWIEKFGIPISLYTDRKNVYVINRETTVDEDLAGEEPLTAFGKACKKLGIKIIEAHSPQAKGRVERKNGVFQDRLIKDMAFHAIDGMVAGNGWLQEVFLDDLNGKFVREPLEKENYHRKKSSDCDLSTIFCWEETRQVQNDWLITWQNRWFQLLKENPVLPHRKNKVTVRELLNGEIRIVFQGVDLRYKEIKKPQGSAAVKPVKKNVVDKKPSEDHPWRKSFSQMFKRKTSQNKMENQEKGIHAENRNSGGLCPLDP